MTTALNPDRPPPEGGPHGTLAKALAGDYDFSVYGTLREAWSLVPGSKMTFFLAGLAIFGIVMIASAVLSFIIPGARAPHAGFFATLLMQIAVTVVSYPFFLGMMMLGLRRAVGLPIEVRHAFGYFRLAVPVAISAVLIAVLTALGFLLLLLPGIYLCVAYVFTLPLIGDKALDAWAAMETSRRAVTPHWFKVCAVAVLPGIVLGIAFGIAAGLLAGAGAPSVGGAGFALAGILMLLLALAASIWLGPLIVIALGVLYRIIFGIEERTLHGG